MCKHFAVSRTVTRDVLSGLHERSTFQKDRTSHRVAEPLSGRRLDEQHEVRRLLEPAGPQKATSLLAPADLAAMLTRLKAATPGCA